MAKQKSDIFNPIKEDKDGVLAKRLIWSSQSLDIAIKGLVEGKKLVANPFYENNVKLIKGDLVFQRTDWEIEEWMRCKNDILYFAEKYCQLMTPQGIRNIELRDYQKRYLEHLSKNRLSIYLACRQCSKTTMSAIFMIHYICFNTDKTALCTGNKRKTAVEVLDKIKKIYFELPYFLKPGIYKWNEAEVSLDNGCRILAEATTLNTGIGFTIHLLLLDEFAHLPSNIADKFYNNIFPTIVASKSRLMITSTQNGYNLFYRLYAAAEAGENDYAPFKTDWYEVPEWNPDKKCWEKRDEVWHQRQVANYGSEEAFNSQFGTNFDVGASTLISQRVLRKKRMDVVEFVEKDLLGVPYSNYCVWHPDYEPMDELKKDSIIVTCDLAEGVGNDYITYSFNRLIEPGSGKIECIGMFRANVLKREECVLSLLTLCCLYCNMDNLLISFEKNTYGDIFLRQIYDLIEHNPTIGLKFDQNTLVKYATSDIRKTYTMGIKLTAGNKSAHCLVFKESYEKNNIINNSRQFMTELDKFCDDGTGHFKASYGHDDMVMTMVQLEFVKTTLQYKFLKEIFDSTSNYEIKDDGYNPFESATSISGENWNPYIEPKSREDLIKERINRNFYEV